MCGHNYLFTFNVRLFTVHVDNSGEGRYRHIKVNFLVFANLSRMAKDVIIHETDIRERAELFYAAFQESAFKTGMPLIDSGTRSEMRY